MELRWGHLFDMIIINNDTQRAYQQLLNEVNSLEREPQWVPAHWLKHTQRELNGVAYIATFKLKRLDDDQPTHRCITNTTGNVADATLASDHIMVSIDMCFTFYCFVSQTYFIGEGFVSKLQTVHFEGRLLLDRTKVYKSAMCSRIVWKVIGNETYLELDVFFVLRKSLQTFLCESLTYEVAMFVSHISNACDVKFLCKFCFFLFII